MQKNIRILIIGVVLVGVSLLGVYWLQQYLQRSRASATAPTTSFVIAGPKINPGDSFDLILQINPNLTPFFSFDIAFTYDPAKVSLKVTDVANILSNITPLSTKENEVVDVKLLTGTGNTSIDTNTHTVHITAIRDNGANDPFMGRDPIKMVKVSFVMNQGQALPLDFKWVDPDPAKTTTSDSFEKKDLSYTGEEPSPTPGPTSVPPVGVATSTPVPGAVQPTSAYNALTPVPTVIGGSGQEGSTTSIIERKDLLYINSIASYQAPFRYEQALKLEKGTYTLTVGAKMYVRKGRGMVIALICNETTCGSKRKGSPMYVSPGFPIKTEYSQMTNNVTIPEDADNKEYILRVFCEDGSECDIDYITFEDAWGSERLKNNNFTETQSIIDPRKQPTSWEVDSTANLYGSVDPSAGKNGALMINNSAK
ncbi:MAG: hypothetical protein V1922_05910 [bacterium]